LYAALLDIATRGESYAVLNLSLGSSVNDEAFASGIRDCVRAGVVVVAAMGDDGNGGSSPIFPAAQCEVIAVGGTDEFDNKQRSSKTGAHIWISAPSDRIRTLAENDTYEPQNGTSYAAPMVSAAVWLARRANPSLTTDQARELLSRAVASAAVPSVRDPQLGFGRLDMVKLAQLVREKP
jgi:minor extracellular protease Epr